MLKLDSKVEGDGLDELREAHTKAKQHVRQLFYRLRDQMFPKKKMIVSKKAQKLIEDDSSESLLY